jgi:hypothetical protein
MKIKGIKRGKTIEIFHEINIPDGEEIIIDIPDEKSSSITIEDSISKFWKSLEKFRHEENLEAAGIEPDIFAGLRDSSPGREVSW